jgi:hypothetical protein
MVRMRHRLIIVCRESTRIQRAGAQRDRLVTFAGVRARLHRGGAGERVVKNTASAASAATTPGMPGCLMPCVLRRWRRCWTPRRQLVQPGRRSRERCTSPVSSRKRRRSNSARGGDMFETSVFTARAVARRRYPLLSASIGIHTLAVTAILAASIRSVSFPRQAPNEFRAVFLRHVGHPAGPRQPSAAGEGRGTAAPAERTCAHSSVRGQRAIGQQRAGDLTPNPSCWRSDQHRGLTSDCSGLRAVICYSCFTLCARPAAAEPPSR